MPDEMEGQPDAGLGDIESILTGTSQSESAGSSAPGTPNTTQGQAPAGEFTFGGRKYPSQQEAEKAHNTLYGRFSESQGVLNQLKAALKDPELMARFQADPKWAPILAKLGIQAAEEEVEEEREEDAQRGEDYSQLPPSMQQFIHQQKVESAGYKLDREEFQFERKLGRPVTDAEHNATMKIISRASNLSYEEGWKLAHHDRLLKESAEKAARSAPPAKGGRPAPLPSFVPGVKLDLKKPIGDMSKTEYREHLRNSDEFKNLMSRG